MHFTQYYLDCLSQASYLVGDETTGRAVVVDPRRDVEDYLADAAAAGLHIVGVVNTHFHADFVSGHLELADRTGAWIGYGAAAQAEFEMRPLADGEWIPLGGPDGVALRILATPGHTPESITVLVYEHVTDEIPYAALTGDALFIGDVGRPDLLASIGVTADELAGQLYHSVQHTLMGLPDPVRVFPAHGAGSACGKNLSTQRQSTIGEQRRTNYACAPMSEQEFVALVTAGQPAAPEYFSYNAMLNRQERPRHDAAATLPALSAAELDAAVAAGAVVLDTRPPTEFAHGHLRGSINVPFDGRLAETVGMVVTPDTDIVLVTSEGLEDETAMRMARIGFDRAIGHLARPEAFFVDHPERVERASRLTVAELTAALARTDDPVTVLDVRNPGELAEGVVPGSTTVPLAEVRRRLAELDTTRPVVVVCAGGWRSSVAASLLRRHGFPDVSDLLGGYAAWQSATGHADAGPHDPAGATASSGAR